jgi:hypothetical protein
MVIEHELPRQAPPHPPKVEPAFGVAVRVTFEPAWKAVLHELGQVIPAGVLVTVPVPVPARFTVSGLVPILNVAVIDCAALMVTEQLPLPEQPPPLQPKKIEPKAGVAVRVTTVPLA